MTTEQRLIELERQLKRTRGLLAAIVIAGLAVACVGQQRVAVPTGVTEVVKAQRFVAVDEKGTERAFFGVKDGQVGVVLNDDKGKPRAGMGVGERNMTQLFLLSAKGTPRISLEVRPDGLPRVFLYDDTHNVLASLTVDEKNQPVFELSNVNGATLFKKP